MKISRNQTDENVEINLIPLIDILLVIVIFLVVNTTFVKQSQLTVQLPGTETAQPSQPDQEPLVIAVGRDGNYSWNQQLIASEQQLRTELTLFLSSMDTTALENLSAVIEADAAATHQSVVSVMDILASLGIVRVSIATASR
ncbi:MAG: biopolymer transporter ExbD [Limnobacter sp.]|nr:biopolymer transporter ExbD [Limnobacter sp.]